MIFMINCLIISFNYFNKNIKIIKKIMARFVKKLGTQ